MSILGIFYPNSLFLDSGSSASNHPGDSTWGKGQVCCDLNHLSIMFMCTCTKQTLLLPEARLTATEHWYAGIWISELPNIPNNQIVLFLANYYTLSF